MPDAGELFGGFWDVCPSAVVDDYAAALTLLADAAVSQFSTPAVKTFVVRADEVESAAAENGRGVYSYPAPPDAPAWVTGPSSAVGPVWCRGVDYELVDDRIVFDVDPLETFTPRTVWVAGSPVAAVDLWYGRSAAARDATEKEPGTYAALVAAVTAACDSPAAGGTETVEAVDSDATGYRVVTDAAVYRLAAADTPAVSVGDVLSAGDPLGTAWALTRLGPTKPTLTHLTLPVEFLQGATVGGITWYDEVVPVAVDTDSGRTRVRFRLGATDETDFDAFWAAGHANGIANGLTLADALDARTSPTTEPMAADLPAFVNPLELVCRELLCGNAWALIVRSDRLGPAAAGSADRSVLVTRAAGPYAAVFEYEDDIPPLDPIDP